MRAVAPALHADSATVGSHAANLIATATGEDTPRLHGTLGFVVTVRGSGDCCAKRRLGFLRAWSVLVVTSGRHRRHEQQH